MNAPYDNNNNNRAVKEEDTPHVCISLKLESTILLQCIQCCQPDKEICRISSLLSISNSVQCPVGGICTCSRVWNKRTPLNKRSAPENLSKRIIVAPFLPYTMKSGIRPQPLEKCQKFNNCRATFIPDSRVYNNYSLYHQK